jgi:hypothetical protein
VVRVGRDVAIPKAGGPRDERAQLVALLRSPQMATGLSLRTATWMLKDMATGKLRVFVETETSSGRAPGAASVAYLLIDDKGKPAATALLSRTQAERSTASGGVSLTVAPGQYTLRAAARDARGRVGSVFHPAPAALQSAEGVELSDLLLGPAPEQGTSFRPAPDPTLAAAGDALGAHVELYANEAAQLDPLVVWLDVVRADTAAVSRTVRAQIGATPQQGRRVAQAMIRGAGLEPGDYVARAKVFSGERELAAVSRPFRVAAR